MGYLNCDLCVCMSCNFFLISYYFLCFRSFSGRFHHNQERDIIEGDEIFFFKEKREREKDERNFSKKNLRQDENMFCFSLGHKKRH